MIRAGIGIRNRAALPRTGNLVALLVLSLSVSVMLFSGYRLWQAEQAYRQAGDWYTWLNDMVRLGGLPGFIHNENGGAAADVEIPPMDIDFAALQAVSPDAVAWLYCPGTVIDYPVMRATDYSYYLYHLPDGTPNNNGALFIDYNNVADFSGRLTVVYGHHTKSGQMFGSLEGYRQQAYYAEHPYMYLYTEHGNYRIDLMYGCVIGIGFWRSQGFMYEENLDALLAYVAENTTFESGVGNAGGGFTRDNHAGSVGDARSGYADNGYANNSIDGNGYSGQARLVVFSTCSYDFDGARYIVVGWLRPEYENR